MKTGYYNAISQMLSDSQKVEKVVLSCRDLAQLDSAWLLIDKFEMKWRDIINANWLRIFWPWRWYEGGKLKEFLSRRVSGLRECLQVKYSKLTYAL